MTLGSKTDNYFFMILIEILTVYNLDPYIKTLMYIHSNVYICTE